MQLTLTIKEVQDKETLVLFKAVFGSLLVTLPDAKGKDKKQKINFITPISEIKGLERIVEGITTSVLALKKQNSKDKTKVTGDIVLPNRATRRS